MYKRTRSQTSRGEVAQIIALPAPVTLPAPIHANAGPFLREYLHRILVSIYLHCIRNKCYPSTIAHSSLPLPLTQSSRGWPTEAWSAREWVWRPSRSCVTKAMRRGYELSFREVREERSAAVRELVCSQQIDPNSEDPFGTTVSKT